MKRDDVLEIANRLKSEGRAISPVTVCLEAYGQSLPEISATLQQWREESMVQVDSRLTTLPTPEDFGDVIRDAVERCWAVAQKSVRGQVDGETRALKERAEQAERETGMLYIDLTRTLNELDACKRKLTERQEAVPEVTRMVSAVAADKIPVVADSSATVASEPPVGPESHSTALDERSQITAEPSHEDGIDTVTIDQCSASDGLSAVQSFTETDAETVIEDIQPAPASESHLVVDSAENLLEVTPQMSLAESARYDRLAEQLASAEARALAAEARAEELEAQMANAAQSANLPTTEPTTAQDEERRIAEMETAFSRERQVLQTKLEEAILQYTVWKQRTEQLRTDFAPLKEHATWVNAQLVGRSALCSRLIVELAQVSPGNALLRKDVQQQIVDAAAQSHMG